MLERLPHNYSLTVTYLLENIYTDLPLNVHLEFSLAGLKAITVIVFSIALVAV